MILKAFKTYSQIQGTSYTTRVGKSSRYDTSWVPDRRIIDALDEAFYLSFNSVVSCGKNIVIGIDTSGSMYQRRVENLLLTPVEIAAVMAMVVARREPNNVILGFDTVATLLNISPQQRLDDVIRNLPRNPLNTDYSSPFRLLEKEGITNAEAIILYGDQQTWSGSSYPSEALRDYRKIAGPTRYITALTSAVRGTTADLKDPLSLTVVGFDTSTPALISTFLQDSLSG